MIEKLIDATPGNEIPQLLIQAEDFFKEQKYEEAKKIYENLVALDPGNIKIISGLLRCLIQMKMFDDAKEMLESLDEKTIESNEIIKIRKLLDSLNSNENSTSTEELKIQLQKIPDNKNVRLELSILYLQSNQIEKGFQELLTLYGQDPKWNDEAAKKKLLEYFEMLGFNDPNVMEARKKLSSLMFK